MDCTARVVQRALICLGLLVACGESADVEADRADEPRPARGGVCSEGAQLEVVFNVIRDYEETGDIMGLIDGGRILALTHDGASFDPDFTPDGSRIVFSSGSELSSVSDTVGPQRLSLFIIDGDGSNRTRLTDGNSDVHPDVSPDGTTVAFARHQDDELVTGPGRTRLRLVDIQSRREEPLLESRSGEDAGLSGAQPAWSPSGEQIAFVRSRPRGLRPPEDSIWIVNRDGTELRKLLGGLESVYALSWSPDGRRLAYSTRHSEVAAWVVDVQDPQPREVSPSSIAPTWSADGTALLFYRDQRQPGSLTSDIKVVERDLRDGHERVLDTGRAFVGFVYGYYDIDARPCARR